MDLGSFDLDKSVLAVINYILLPKKVRDIMLSAAAYNFKRMMRKWESSFVMFFYHYLILPIISFFKQTDYSKKLNSPSLKRI